MPATPIIVCALLVAPTPIDGADTPTRTVTRPYRVPVPVPVEEGVDPCDEFQTEFAATAVGDEGDTPSELAFTPDGTKLVIAHRDSMNLVVLDANTRDVLDVIALSGSPNSLAITPDGTTVVTANLFEDTMSIVDLGAATETAAVVVGDQPGVVRITPDGTTAIVGNTIDADLSVVDIAGATETHQIPGTGFAQVTSFGAWAIVYRFTDFVISPDSATIVFPDRFADQILFIDIASGTTNPVAATMPITIDLSVSGARAVVAQDFPNSQVMVLDIASQTIANTWPTGGSATSVPAIAIDGTGSRCCVAVQNNVRVLNLLSGLASPDLFTGTPNDLVRSWDGQYCIVGNFSGSVISFGSASIVGNYLSTTTPDALAVSPAGPRAATAHALRKEVTEVYNVDGAAGFLEEVAPTGPPPEGDKARGVALTSDGGTALVINNHSQNVTVIDTATNTVLDAVATGERPGGVAVTPDDTRAVVANLDSSFATVVDIAGGTATNVPISRRGSAVAISPDGTYAYIPVVADGDGVWRINLNTLTAEGGKIPTGNMGGIGFPFDQASGMTLSHDGATLVTCGSFTNDLSVIDTATWTEVARVPVGTFPVRAIFSADDSTIYVSNRNDDTVSVVSNAGPASAVVDTIAVFDQPFLMTLNPAGSKLYVACYADKLVAVYDLPGGVLSDLVTIPETNGGGEPLGLHMAADGTALYIAANGADFHVVATSTHTIADTINTGLAPARLLFDDASRCAYMPTPFGDDGLSIVRIVNPCACPADLDGSGDVGFGDILQIIGAWGPCGVPCPEDLSGNGNVDFADILAVIAAWGPCP
ncbi:MAG: YncE family protein [Planctomycetota bacterium]|jgi:YVTN family beta-propeller protein